MRMIRDKTGRFRERPFYDNEELDVECERIASDFLRRTHGDIRWPITTDDLTKLVEENVDDLDLYADLAESGAKVEGVTNFFADRRPCVEISRELSANKRNANRLRTTLTHELGHVRFHGFLFQLPTKEFGDLFSTGVRWLTELMWRTRTSYRLIDLSNAAARRSSMLEKWIGSNGKLATRAARS